MLFALLIKLHTNTGWHTIISFILARVYSTQSPLITSAPFYFACGFWEPPDASPDRLPWRGYFNVHRWKVLHLVQWSSVLFSITCLSAIRHQCVSFPKQLFLVPGELSEHTIQICRDHRLCCNMLWTTEVVAPQQKFTFSNGKTLVCRTIVKCALQILQRAQRVSCDGFILLFSQKWLNI